MKMKFLSTSEHGDSPLRQFVLLRIIRGQPCLNLFPSLYGSLPSPNPDDKTGCYLIIPMHNRSLEKTYGWFESTGYCGSHSNHPRNPGKALFGG
ncbi:MAG: hypothetical protein QG657_1684 [Acidobacteriota bacterium]|nr:hypothetical protein [Acidobacteriota bacterium]